MERARRSLSRARPKPRARLPTRPAWAVPHPTPTRRTTLRRPRRRSRGRQGPGTDPRAERWPAELSARPHPAPRSRRGTPRSDSHTPQPPPSDPATPALALVADKQAVSIHTYEAVARTTEARAHMAATQTIAMGRTAQVWCAEGTV